jgi:hypothetical protein
MTKQQPKHDVIEGLKGSEQHHPLKNRPGEKGDANHTHPKPKKADSEEKSKDDS